jgi:guanylate kinase
MTTSRKLLLFCGPSGSGKTTIVHHLLEYNPRLSFSISATTRPKRAKEKEGVDYYFISVDEFKNRIAHNEFVEWEEVYKDRFYGTLHSEIERIWKENKIVVFDVDVEGGLKIKKIYGDVVLAVFVMPPNIDELHKRLTTRNSETPESFRARTEKSEHELSYAGRFDFVLVNDRLDKALKDAQEIVNKFLGNL